MNNSPDIHPMTNADEQPEVLAEISSWLIPISESAPCGLDLEYDTEYGVLQAKLMPKAEVQYGDFRAAPQAPDWVDIEQDCRRLLSRSRDITLLIWLLRCRINLAGAIGMQQGLSILQAVIRKYPDEVHPQVEFDGVLDRGVRANALAALCDPEGLLADARQVIVSANTASRLSLRDIERSFALPRVAQAMAPEAVKRQLDDMQARGNATLRSLQAAAAILQDINQWATQYLADDAPDLSALIQIMSAFMPAASESQTRAISVQAMQADVTENPSQKVDINSLLNTSTNTPASIPALSLVTEAAAVQLTQIDTYHSRENIRQTLIQLRVWIEQNEPSSPAAILLKQAERVWGKRFSEVAGLIPADLLSAWDQAE